MLVIALAALFVWMLKRMPKKAGAELYGWYFLMVVIGVVLFGASLRLLGLQR